MKPQDAFNQAYALAKGYVDETLKGEGALKGKDGESAYQIALDNGFVGNQEDWLESLKGKDGNNGLDGFSPIITENAGNTDNIYKLDITTAYGTITTPDLKGDDGDGAGKINKIKVNDAEVPIDEYNKSVNIEVPTKVSELENDENFISEIPSEYITEEKLEEKGYLTEIPSNYVTDEELSEKGYLTEVPENYVTDSKMQEYAQPKGEYALLSEAGFSLVLSVNPTTYLMEIQLKNKSGQVLSSQNFDFPIETAFTNVNYDKTTHQIVFTLQNGTTTEPIDISDIVRGLVPDDRTIAGLNLKEDITAEQLKTALGLDKVDNTPDSEKNVLSAESSNMVIGDYTGVNGQSVGTIKDLREKLSILETESNKTKTKYTLLQVNVSNKFIEMWNSDDIDTRLELYRRYSFHLLSSRHDGKAGLWLIANNEHGEIYTVSHYNGVWDKIKKLALEENIPTSLPANGGNANTVGGFTALSFLGNNTGYIYPSKNGEDANDYKTEYHGFVFNMKNTPTSYGFLNVSHFDGSGFAPSSSKPVVWQQFIQWNTGKVYTRVYAEYNDIWTEWNLLLNVNESNPAIPVENGGTGKTSAQDACNAFLNALSTETRTSVPKDDDYYISQYVNGGTTNTTYNRRPVSALLEYIKSKLGITVRDDGLALGGITKGLFAGLNDAGTSIKDLNDAPDGFWVIDVGNTIENTPNGTAKWAGGFFLQQTTSRSGRILIFQFITKSSSMWFRQRWYDEWHDWHKINTE